MNCCCETNASGDVTSACRAHMVWFEYVVGLNHWQEKAKDLEKAQKDLEYQTKRADMFERILIDKKI